MPVYYYIIGILFFWCFFLTVIIFYTLRGSREAIKLSNKGKLLEIIEKTLNQEKDNALGLEKLNISFQNYVQESKSFINKISLLRYNPFGDTGGDQSFVLGLFDQHKNGFILTSLHSRTGTRWYAKQIKQGQSIDYALSKEEKQLINEN